MDTPTILTRVLTIIDYQDDKHQFVDQFSSQCVRLTILTLIDTLPGEKKKALLTSIDSKQGVAEMRVALLKYTSEESFQHTLEKTAQKLFEDYIETVIPVLTTVQKTNLLDFLSSMGSRDVNK